MKYLVKAQKAIYFLGCCHGFFLWRCWDSFESH